MKLTDAQKKKLAELRKIEKQAKALIFKMRKLEENYKNLRNELRNVKALPPRLGDILASWSKI